MKILKVSSQKFKNIIQETEKFLKEGKVIVCPTDTVYGLLCDATNGKAVRRIFKIKKRKITKPLPLFVRDFKMAKKIAKINKQQMVFLKKIWPGKITAILKPKLRKFPKGIGKDRKEIGLRIPNYKFLFEILKRLNKPIAQTSANISGKSIPKDIKGILKQFQKEKFQPDLIFDKGKLNQKPSVLLDLTGSSPKILRK